MLQFLTCNVAGKSRSAVLNGRNYLVVPMVMLTEGVHNGSEGALYYPPEEMSKFPVVWNHKPISVYHPEQNGQGISATELHALAAQSVGIILNTKYEPAKVADAAKKTDATPNRLSAEAWFEKTRLSEVDPRIEEKLNRNEMVEVSTGLYCETEPTAGVWNSESYVGIARNFHPDHLAVLPDKKGACSIADGAGLLRNETSMDSIREAVCGAHRAAHPSRMPNAVGDCCYTYVTDVYTNFYIYRDDASDNFFQQAYKIDAALNVTFEGNPVSVRRVQEYRTTDGAFVGNALVNSSETANVEKKTLVDGLIANAGWEEIDRPHLMTLSEDKLKKLVAKVPAVTTNTATVPAVPAVPVVGVAAPILNAATTPVATPAPKMQTLAEYIAAAPPEISSLLSDAIITQNAEKSRLVEVIKQNPKNQFNDQFLLACPLDQLRGMAALCPTTNNDQAAARSIFLGAGGAVPTTNAGKPAEPEAPLPSAIDMGWKKSA